MNLKRILIINVVLSFVLSFITHFVYQVFPNTFTSIFFPVNESIWEHMKMLFTTILLSNLIIFIINKKYDIKYNNFLFSVFIQAFLSIPIFLLMFLPYNYFFKENLIIISIFMIITFIIINIITYKLAVIENNDKYNYLSIVLIIICYIVFAYLTYNPIKNSLFLDKKENKYGINNYIM